MADTSQLPLANDYLELRAELGAALFALTSLAAETHAPASISVLRRMQTQLHEPFVLVAAGDGNAGKSSLLNAIFGREFCRAHSSPDSGRIHVFKHGDAPRNVTAAPHLTERYRPLNFLRDFNVVDLPGATGMAESCRSAAGQLTPKADLLLFVVSILDPWAAGAWELLETLPPGGLDHMVCVLQQADRREEREIHAVTRHLQQRFQQRFGRTFPVFPVSAKKALLSKTTGVDKGRLWTESHFEPLEAHIAQCVREAEYRRGKLHGACRVSLSLLDELSARSNEDWRKVGFNRAQLASLRESALDLKAGTESRFGEFEARVDAAYACCESHAEHSVARWLCMRRLPRLILSRKRKRAKEICRETSELMRTAVGHEVSRSLGQLETELNAAWSQLRGRLQTDFHPEARSHLGPGVPDFTERRESLTDEIQLMLVEHAADEEPCRTLSASLANIAARARAAAEATLGGAGLTLAVGLAAGPRTAAVGCLLTAAIAVAGMCLVSGARRRILAEFRGQMQARRQELVAAIMSLLRAGAADFYGQLDEAWVPLAIYCEAEAQRCRPYFERVSALEKTFQKLSQRLP